MEFCQLHLVENVHGSYELGHMMCYSYT